MSKYVFLDTETTGTDPVKNGIIQLSGIIVIPDKQIEEPFDLKMQPFPADEIDDRALAVTGTTREELANRPLGFDGYRGFIRLLGRHRSATSSSIRPSSQASETSTAPRSCSVTGCTRCDPGTPCA